MLACAHRQQTSAGPPHQTCSHMKQVVRVAVGVRGGCPGATRRRRKQWESHRDASVYPRRGTTSHSVSFWDVSTLQDLGSNRSALHPKVHVRSQRSAHPLLGEKSPCPDVRGLRPRKSVSCHVENLTRTFKPKTNITVHSKWWSRKSLSRLLDPPKVD